MKRYLLASMLMLVALGGCSANGMEGPTGSAGAEGVEGPQGNAGSQGTAGPQGDAGPAGSAGPQGPGGPQGPEGTSSSVGTASPPREAGAGSSPHTLGEAILNATTASERNYSYSGSVLLDHDGRCLLTAVVTMQNAVSPDASAAQAAVAYSVGNGAGASCGLANFVVAAGPNLYTTNTASCAIDVPANTTVNVGCFTYAIGNFLNQPIVCDATWMCF
jgi:Collagen triple helix repeat (20 copies)